MDHLLELRSRLIWSAIAFFLAFLLCFFLSDKIYLFLIHPFQVAGALIAAQKASGHAHGPFDLFLALLNMKEVAIGQGGDLELIFTAPLEFFFAKLKLAGFGAIILSFPVIAYQLYRFVAPGLYRRERHAFLPFLIAAPILFLLGAALVYYVMLPFVMWFSLSQQISAPGVTVSLLPKVGEYLSLVTTLMLAFGLCFQLPVVLSLLGMSGIVKSSMLIAGRRFAIVGIAVVAAIVTPPDPISMLMLCAPLWLLYEVSIWCVKLIELRRPKDEDGTVAPEGVV
ncbi:MAG: twin-arginine translocase subunit TatC [Caulobacteraceae bacterium]|nr:twin-arginine translocase subunit TatC [Caulobacteraceae bacterium]